MSHAKRGKAGVVTLALYMIFFFLLLFMGLDRRRFLHKRKGDITHYAHMFALRDCWDRHD